MEENKNADKDELESFDYYDEEEETTPHPPGQQTSLATNAPNQMQVSKHGNLGNNVQPNISEEEVTIKDSNSPPKAAVITFKPAVIEYNQKGKSVNASYNSKSAMMLADN